MIMASNSCYWCGKPATSKEHVPPKCIFPEEKDIKSICDKSFRKQLITVPSCDEHNLSKSSDDEYLMSCLAPYVGNNGVAYIHTNTKVRRAVERNKTLMKVLYENIIHVKDLNFPILIVITRLKKKSDSMYICLLAHLGGFKSSENMYTKDWLATMMFLLASMASMLRLLILILFTTTLVTPIMKLMSKVK